MVKAPKPMSRSERLRTLSRNWIRDVDSYSLLVRKWARANQRQHRVFWLKAVHFNASSLESLELFALLARADWTLWLRLAQDIWPDLHETCAVSLNDLAPTTVGIKLMCGRSPDQLDVLRRACGAPAPSEARDLMLAMIAERGNSVSDVPVRVGISNEQMLFLEEFPMLSKTVQVAAAQYRDQERANRGAYRGLCIHSITFSMKAQDPWRLQLLRPLADTAALGVPLAEFGSIAYDVFRDARDVYVAALQRLFAIEGESRGVESATLVTPMRLEMAASMFSANGLRLLLWLAYALFRRDVVLRKLTLDVGTLTQVDVEVMDTVLNAHDPLEQLLGRQESMRGVTISAQHFSLLDPPTNRRATLCRRSFESFHLLAGLDVIQQTDDWMSVLLPGWGRAWVHQDDVLNEQRSADNSTPPVINSIPQMKLEGMKTASRDAVLALLEHVGGGVERLSITDYVWENPAEDEPLDAAWLTRLFQVCPILHSLKLVNVDFVDLHGLLAGYASGICRIKRLELKALVDIEEAATKRCLRELFVALSDPQHPIAHCLEEFACSELEPVDLFDAEFVSVMITMLEQNTYLRVLDLSLLVPHGDRTNASRRRVFDCQILPQRRCLTAVELARRVAFLSVVTPRDATDENTKTAMESLDASALSLIFEFAARLQIRCVCINFESKPGVV